MIRVLATPRQQNQIRPYNESEVLNANSDHDSPQFLELLLTPAVGP